MSSIRRQLSLTLVLGFGGLLAASGAAIYFFTRMALMREFDAGLRTQATAIMSAAEQGEDGLQFEAGDLDFPGFDKESGLRFFEVWRGDTSVCARSESLNGADLQGPPFYLSGPVYYDFTMPDGRLVRAIGVKFWPKTEHEDDVAVKRILAMVVVAADRRTVDQTLATLAAMLVTTGVLAMLLTVPLVGLSLRRGHAPLALLARQAAAINADSLQARFPVDSLPAELQPIAGRLNDLLGRLEASFERERRFSADLAHELRTPLAELRTHAEVELQCALGAEAEKHRETLEIALQMETMVTRLLELVRSENGQILPQWETVGLAALLAEVWRPLAARAGSRLLTVDFQVPPDASLRTDRTLFRSILANLLSNAVEYAPAQGAIVVCWREDASELTISNLVHDLGADDVPHLFERLWRKDKSRTGTDHYGLGLALSREFARLLGLNLTARLGDGKVLILSLAPQIRSDGR